MNRLTKTLLLVLTMVFVFNTNVLAKENTTDAYDHKNHVSISEDGTKLVVDKPTICWSRLNEDDYLDDKELIVFVETLDKTVGNNKAKTVEYFYEFQLYNAKTNKLIQSETANSTDWEGLTTDWGSGYAGKLIFYNVKKLSTTPYYAKVRVTVTDTKTGLSGTSDWSDPLYYVPAVKMNKIVQTSNSAKISWKKLNIKGVKNYTIYIKRYKTEKQFLNNSWVKVATTKKTNYTIKKFKKSSLNFKKYDYAVKIVANMKFKGKTRQTPEVMCNMRYLK